MDSSSKSNVNFSDFPSEISDKLETFDDCLGDVETLLNDLFTVPHNDIQDKLFLIDKAKLDLMAAYTINSLFWVYLNTRGENPKEHPVKQELERIRSYMARIKEIEDRQNAPKLNKAASKRFVKSALWKAAHKQADEAHKQSASPSNDITSENPKSTTKRKHSDIIGKDKRKKK